MVLPLFTVRAYADELALPGYQYRIPRDYFAHPNYQTEWWYYTGNVKAPDGRRFGFEVTFFRFHPDEQASDAEQNSVWNPAQVYIAHFALSDLAGKHFYHNERINRAGPGIAGVDNTQGRIWNGNWGVHWLSFEPARQQLEAVSDKAHLQFNLQSQKPLVVNGQNGVSQKGPQRGEASHYFSLTRMAVSGTLSLNGTSSSVTGTAWMDREFFSAVPNESTAGWDWMCIQLNNNEELMLYRLRLKDGSLSSFSSGTFVAKNGDSIFLDHSRYSLKPLAYWHSSVTGSDYPISWQIDVPSKQLTLKLTTPLSTQELTNKVTRSYWEGAVDYNGTEAGAAVQGVGYLEMTGYTKQEQGNQSKFTQR